MMARFSKYIFPLLSNSRELEEDTLPSGSFTGEIAKGCKFSLFICSVTMFGMGLLASGDEIAVFFWAIGLFIAALLPTYFSYRCYVDKRVLKITCFILCFKITKEILWRDAAYKIVKRDAAGNPQSIRLLDAHGKTLASFDAVIVGFSRIVKLAKHIPKLKK